MVGKNYFTFILTQKEICKIISMSTDSYSNTYLCKNELNFFISKAIFFLKKKFNEAKTNEKTIDSFNAINTSVRH